MTNRIPLAHLPTPIEPLPRLTKLLQGPRLFIKRDDLTGLGLGGNKTRKLEYLAADALAQGCRTLITTGAVQSNHCRQVAAAAAQLGLGCLLVLAGEDPGTRQGNLLLDGLSGAKIVFVPKGQRDAALRDEFERAQAQGQAVRDVMLNPGREIEAVLIMGGDIGELHPLCFQVEPGAHEHVAWLIVQAQTDLGGQDLVFVDSAKHYSAILVGKRFQHGAPMPCAFQRRFQGVGAAVAEVFVNTDSDAGFHPVSVQFGILGVGIIRQNVFSDRVHDGIDRPLAPADAPLIGNIAEELAEIKAQVDVEDLAQPESHAGHGGSLVQAPFVGELVYGYHFRIAVVVGVAVVAYLLVVVAVETQVGLVIGSQPESCPAHFEGGEGGAFFAFCGVAGDGGDGGRGVAGASGKQGVVIVRYEL